MAASRMAWWRLSTFAVFVALPVLLSWLPLSSAWQEFQVRAIPKRESLSKEPLAQLIASATSSLASGGHCPKPTRVVVTLSTFEGRLGRLKGTVASLSAQSCMPDAIYIFLSRRPRTKRTGAGFGGHGDGVDTTEALESLRDLSDRVIVRFTDEDWGPGTKLLAALKVEEDPNTWLITVDDDTTYHQDTVLALVLAASALPSHAAPGFWCEEARATGVASDQIQWQTLEIMSDATEGTVHGWCGGFAGVLFKRWFFDETVFNFADAPDGCAVHDDVWFGGHLLSKGNTPYLINAGFFSAQDGPSTPEDRQDFSINVINRQLKASGKDPQEQCAAWFSAFRGQQFSRPSVFTHPSVRAPNGEDLWVLKNFFQSDALSSGPMPRSGKFVELGASDGLTNTSTYFLEKELGWHGIQILPESSEAQIAQLTANRPKSVSLQGVLCGQNAAAADPPCRSLQQLLQEGGLHRHRVNYLVANLGGSELEAFLRVLAQLPFKDVDVDLVQVGVKLPDPILSGKGCKFAADLRRNLAAKMGFAILEFNDTSAGTTEGAQKDHTQQLIELMERNGYSLAGVLLVDVGTDLYSLTDNDRAVRRGAIVKLVPASAEFRSADYVLSPVQNYSEEMVLKLQDSWVEYSLGKDKALLSSRALTRSKASPEYVRRVFLEELHKFADQGEKCREVSLSMTLRFADLLPVQDLENVLPLLLAALLGRFRSHPFPEQSEELRLEALRLLSHLFDLCKERLSPFASDVLDALSKALTDTCPDAKKECCEITKKVSQYFEAERVSRACGPLVGSLLANLKHQQWKVRRATLESIGALLLQEAPMMDHMEDILPHLNALLGDRTPGVRQSLAETLERWLLKGLSFRAPLVSNLNDDGPEGFDKFEPRLLLLLLGVCSDEEAEQVGAVAFGGLERVAALKHEVLLKRAQREREREEAKQKAKEARENKAGYSEDPDNTTVLEEKVNQKCKDPEVAPAFDYTSVLPLLPQPFAAGRLPAALTTTYVRYHLASVLPQVLANLTQWTTDIREAAARLLQVLLVITNQQVAPFLDGVLVHLYKAQADDDQKVAKAALLSASMVGVFIDAELVLEVVGRHLGLKHEGGQRKGTSFDELWPQDKQGRQTTRTVQDVLAGVKNFAAMTAESRRQVFMVLARLIHPCTGTDDFCRRLKPKEVKLALRFLEEGIHSELLTSVLGATESLLKAGREACIEDWPRIFDLLLRMKSSEECNAQIVDANIEHLSQLLGRSRRQLYEEHLRTRLADLLQGGEAVLWEDASPNRHVLETLLRNAGPAVADHVGGLVPVLARQASPEDASATARVDLLGLVHFLVNEEDEALASALKAHALPLLDGVLLPNCSWRPGQSNGKIRRGAMVCVHSLLRRHLVPSAVLNEVFVDLMPILKGCLDDSWSPDNRMIACLVLSCTLADLQAEINGEQLREVYPELLKRLDDSNDKIRVAVCEALDVFFKCLPQNWSRTLYEYILRNLFVHLDDPNPEIQQGIYAVLQAAAPQDTATFLKEAQTASAKSAHPRLCEELVRLAEGFRAPGCQLLAAAWLRRISLQVCVIGKKTLPVHVSVRWTGAIHGSPRGGHFLTSQSPLLEMTAGYFITVVTCMGKKTDAGLNFSKPNPPSALPAVVHFPKGDWLEGLAPEPFSIPRMQITMPLVLQADDGAINEGKAVVLGDIVGDDRWDFPDHQAQWKAELDTESCQATIDFNVPGKPNPPPVNLLMTLWLATSDEASAGQAKATFEFTDPSGKLASPHMPLNSWLSLGTPQVVKAISCPESLKAVYADMHDGDKKAVDIKEGKMTIRPSGNNQTWVVIADVDDRCTAEVDFNVPGKPSPPPVPLELKLWHLQSSSFQKTSFEFSDPSGTLAPPGIPLNAWLEIPSRQSALLF
ncbi:Dnaaf5 [Symbiodinium sp. CCMP2592]|nr:Dnaaf5 [Symbiodinium sp. CCMP2592]